MIGQGIKDMSRLEREDDAVHIPIWMRNTLLGAILALGASGVGTWARSNEAVDINARQDTTINQQQVEIKDMREALQKLTNVTVETHQEVRDMKDVQAQSSGKLDRLLELGMMHK